MLSLDDLKTAGGAGGARDAGGAKYAPIPFGTSPGPFLGTYYGTDGQVYQVGDQNSISSGPIGKPGPQPQPGPLNLSNMRSRKQRNRKTRQNRKRNRKTQKSLLKRK
jgi:hypothetical protein